MLQMLAQQGGQQQGMMAGQQPMNPLLQQMAQAPPQNASLGTPGGGSLATQPDMYAAMMQQPPGSY